MLGNESVTSGKRREKYLFVSMRDNARKHNCIHKIVRIDNSNFGKFHSTIVVSIAAFFFCVMGVIYAVSSWLRKNGPEAFGEVYWVLYHIHRRFKKEKWVGRDTIPQSSFRRFVWGSGKEYRGRQFTAWMWRREAPHNIKFILKVSDFWIIHF